MIKSGWLYPWWDTIFLFDYFISQNHIEKKLPSDGTYFSEKRIFQNTAILILREKVKICFFKNEISSFSSVTLKTPTNLQTHLTFPPNSENIG